MDSKFLSKQILRILKITFNHLSKSKLKNFADIIVAFFYNESFSLREVASKMPGESNVKHKLKRLIYFLDRIKIDDSFFKSYIKTIFSLPNFRFRKRKYITILLDTTTLLDDFLVLAGSISFKGRAIPIYIKIWRGVNEPYDYKGRVKEFIVKLSKLLPEHNYEIIADRGFQGHDMVQIFQGVRWKYVIRIHKNYSVRERGSMGYKQLSLFEDGFYEGVVIGKVKPIEDVNLVVNSIEDEEGGRIRWYLITTLEDKERAIKDYSRRMWIEESFKDLKVELKWEKYTKKIPEKGRLEKMVILSILSYAIQLSIGGGIEIPPSEERKTSILKRFNNILTSSYRFIRKHFITLVTLFKLNYRRSYLFFKYNFG